MQFVTSVRILAKSAFSRLTESDHHFKEAFNDLCRLKRSKYLLQSLCSALQEDIASLEVVVIPASRALGVASLPPETLQVIFHHAAESTDNQERHRTAMILAQVSRRFRQVAVSTPALWNYSESSFSQDRIARTFERCGETEPLTASLDYAFYRQYLEKRLDYRLHDQNVHYLAEKLREHSKQLYSLSVDVLLCVEVRSDDSASREAITKQVKELDDFDSASLKFLTFKSDLSGHLPSWTFSNVTTFSTNRLDYPFMSLPALTHLNITREDQAGDINDLKQLDGHTALKEFDVELNSDDFYDELTYVFVAELPSLESLTVSVAEKVRDRPAYFYDDDDPRGHPPLQCVVAFIKYLNAPQLSSVHLHASYQKFCEYRYGSISLPANSLPNVTTLELEARVFNAELFAEKHSDFRGFVAGLVLSTIKTLTSSMPQIENLELILPGLSPSPDSILALSPTFRTLYLEGWIKTFKNRKCLPELCKKFKKEQYPSLKEVTVVSQSILSCSHNPEEGMPEEGMTEERNAVVMEEDFGGLRFTWEHKSGYEDHYLDE